MTVFKFTLKVDTLKNIEDIAEALFKAGCDDMLLTSNVTGVYLEFDREAKSVRQAVVSAIKDVQKAGFQSRECYIND